MQVEREDSGAQADGEGRAAARALQRGGVRALLEQRVHRDAERNHRTGTPVAGSQSRTVPSCPPDTRITRPSLLVSDGDSPHLVRVPGQWLAERAAGYRVPQADGIVRSG